MPDFLLHWESARSIAESEPEEPDYRVESIILPGAITFFSAKIKAGKTTFIGQMLQSSASASLFLGLRTKPMRVLYCTEEGRKTFRAFLKRVGLEAAENIEVVFLNSVPKQLAWPVVANDILAKALSINADLVIFDTLTRWAQVKPEQENDAGAAAKAMEPLESMRAAGLAVMPVFHDRKSGGDAADAGRGSSAFGGAADIILNLVNPNTNGHPNRRVLSCVGRFDDPFAWTIDLEEGEYVRRGDEDQQVERLDMKMELQMYLDFDGEATGERLAERLGTSTRAGTFRRALDDLVSSGAITRSGSGKRGEPFTYRSASSLKGAT